MTYSSSPFWLAALAALAVGMALVSFGRRKSRRWLVVAGWVWVAYAIWEASVQWFTPEANLRVDLLVIYPLLLVVLVLGVLLGNRRR